MSRRSITLLICTIAALAIHAGGFFAASRADLFGGEHEFPTKPTSIRVVLMPDVPTPIPPEPPKLDSIRLGERAGTGSALTGVDLPNEQQAEQADLEQALLRREAAVPSGALSPPPRPALPELTRVEPLQEAVRRLTETGEDESPPPTESIERIEPIETARPTEPTPPTPVGKPVEATADFAPISDTDSDPFSTKHAVEIGAGGVKARGGREFRIVRPRIDLAFRAEVTRLGTPLGMSFQITLDAKGRPETVEIVRSSGSDVIDRTIRLSLFDAWFEPGEPRRFTFGYVIR